MKRDFATSRTGLSTMGREAQYIFADQKACLSSRKIEPTYLTVLSGVAVLSLNANNVDIGESRFQSQPFPLFHRKHRYLSGYPSCYKRSFPKCSERAVTRSISYACISTIFLHSSVEWVRSVSHV